MDDDDDDDLFALVKNSQQRLGLAWAVRAEPPRRTVNNSRVGLSGNGGRTLAEAESARCSRRVDGAAGRPGGRRLSLTIPDAHERPTSGTGSECDSWIVDRLCRLSTSASVGRSTAADALNLVNGRPRRPPTRTAATARHRIAETVWCSGRRSYAARSTVIFSEF